MKKQGIIITCILAVVAIAVAVYLCTKKKVNNAVKNSLSALSPASTLSDVISELRKTTIRTVGVPLKKIRTTITATNSPIIIPVGKGLVEVVWKSGTGSVFYDMETTVLDTNNKKFTASSTVNASTNTINPTGEMKVVAETNSELQILVTEL